MHVFVPQKSLRLAPPLETISQVIVTTPWQSCSVEGGGVYWSCTGRGIVGLGLVFLVWSETCAPLPFPHPNLSLYYYRLARGAQCGARWAACFSGKLCVRCVRAAHTVFLRALSLCVIEDPLMWFWLAWLASYEQGTMVMRAEGV